MQNRGPARGMHGMQHAPASGLTVHAACKASAQAGPGAGHGTGSLCHGLHVAPQPTPCAACSTGSCLCTTSSARPVQAPCTTCTVSPRASTCCTHSLDWTQCYVGYTGPGTLMHPMELQEFDTPIVQALP